MEIEFEKDAPNVVTEARLRQLLAEGRQAEIVALGNAVRTKGNWYGRWIVRVVNDDRSFERLLVKVPRQAMAEGLEPRVFKTLNGLFSFMLDLGFVHVDVPCHEGGRTVQTLPEGGRA